MRTLSKAMVLILVLATTGCSRGGKIEGDWVTDSRSFWDRTPDGVRKLTVTRNGENFILTEHSEQYSDVADTYDDRGRKAVWGASPPQVVSATLKEGKLIVGPFTSFTYIEKDGTLLGPGGEVYKRETPAEVNRLKQEAAASLRKKYPKVSLQ